MSEPSLTRISGIGSATARVLAEHGFTSVQAVADASSAKLAKVPGFGPARAVAIIASANSLVSVGGTVQAAQPAAKIGKKKDKKGKKGKKKDKKGKKGKKGKKKDKKGKGKKKDKKGKK